MLFTRVYSGGRLLRDMTSLTDQQAKGYIDNLQKLRSSLSEHANVSAAVMVHRVCGELQNIGKGDSVFVIISVESLLFCIEGLQLLSEINFAKKAYGDVDDPKTQCLNGTRTEIIESILRWAVHANCPDPKEEVGGVRKPDARVLWLCGVAGSGKSRISRSVAGRLHTLKRLGSLYCCDYKNRQTLNPGSLFSTIARHLADQDLLRKQHLVAAIRDDTAIRRTEICRLQYHNFIVNPSTGLPAVGDTVIVIDAFDEIGNADDRADALEILTERAHELPNGLRIIVTSRFEQDVQTALRSPEAVGVDYLLMQDIPTSLTVRDISVYVHDALKNVKGLGNLNRLANAAGDSFQWASTACRYIGGKVDRQGTQLPRERLALFVNGNKGLDELYSRILDEHFGDASVSDLERLKLILGQIIGVKEPMSLRGLWELVPRESQAALNLDDFHSIVRHLASLLVNTHDVDLPIFPFHTSFADFLHDANKPHKYLIDINQANHNLAVGCLEVMEQELQFNICRIPTSYKANKDIENLNVLIKDILYASHFWAQHISCLTTVDDATSMKLQCLLSSRFLEWLEVMSVTDTLFQEPLVAIDSSKASTRTLDWATPAFLFVPSGSSCQ